MSKLVTITTFLNSFDIQYNLFKDMLDDAGIGYIVVNENRRIAGGALVVSPTNVAIEIKVDEENAARAAEILKSIK
jgi:hypothetical protein